MKKGLVVYMLVTILMASCNGRFSALKEFAVLKEDGQTLEIRRIENHADDTATVSYQIRILPDSVLLEPMSNSREALWYQMDSSFYVLSGNQKIYPELLQPIANGQKNGFEYLAIFPAESLTNAGKHRLVFHDRYIGKKNYLLNLDKE